MNLKYRDQTTLCPHLNDWIDAHQQRLFRIALGITGDYYFAQDCTQEAFLKAGLNFRQLKDESKLTNWLSKIVINECKSLLRSKAREKYQESTDSSEGISYDVYPSVDTPEIYKYLHRLPKSYKLPIVLHYFGGYSMEEVSQILDLKNSTVRVRTHRGKKLLKNMIEQEEDRNG